MCCQALALTSYSASCLSEWMRCGAPRRIISAGFANAVLIVALLCSKSLCCRKSALVSCFKLSYPHVPSQPSFRIPIIAAGVTIRVDL